MATTIPNLDQYQGDPLIYQEASQPGKMRHTFTGLRTTFPNLGLHYVIAKQVLPLRVLIVQQGAGKQEGPIDVNLMTAIHDGIDNISRTLKTLTFTGEPLNDQVLDRIRRIPLGHWGAPEDVAKATLFLASPMSDFVTGIYLPVDGGWLVL